MAIGTTAAILGAAGLGAAGGAGASYLSQRGARNAAQERSEFTEESLRPLQQLSEAQLQDYLTIQRPYLQSEFDLYRKYRAPTMEAQYGQFQGDIGLAQDVFQPATRTLGSRLVGDLSLDYGLPPEVADRMFGQTRRRISESYAPFRQSASERLAGSGALGTGIGEQVFQNFDEHELQAIEDAAFKQMLLEFELARSGRQQSVSNLMGFLGRQPTAQAPTMTFPTVQTGAIPQYAREAIGSYTPIPRIDPGAIFADAASAGLTFGGYATGNPTWPFGGGGRF